MGFDEQREKFKEKDENKLNAVMNNTSRLFHGKEQFAVKQVIKEARNEKTMMGTIAKEEKKVPRKIQLNPIKKD